MSGTFTQVRNTVISLLKDKDLKVIAITGKWGTGKTYLWNEIKEAEFKNKESRKTIYVSLFGARTINELKLRILQNAYLADKALVKKIVNTGGGFVSGLINKFSGYSTENAVVAWLPEITSDCLVIIDDVERKHSSLHVDELLGMLDEYSEIHKTKFLILLNSDKLTDNKMWMSLHEKVIDAEVVLDPTVMETFDIANRGQSTQYTSTAREAIATLNIKNIRVIERILKTLKFIADEAKDISGIPPGRWVTSSVLLTACHYRAIENAPPFKHIKSFNQYRKWMREKDGEKRSEEEIGWDILLTKLGIQSSDDFEDIMQNYLESGLLETEKLIELFRRYKKESSYSDAGIELDRFFNAYHWDSHKTEQEIFEMADGLINYIDSFGADSMSDIVTIIEKMGNQELSKKILNAALLSLERRAVHLHPGRSMMDLSIRQYHPEIVKKINSVESSLTRKLTLFEVASHIKEVSAWGDMEKSALRNSSPQDYVDTLLSLKAQELKIFLLMNIDWAKNPPYDEDFKIGTANFLAACSQLVNERPDSRLAKIIFRTLDSSGLSSLLVKQSTNV